MSAPIHRIHIYAQRRDCRHRCDRYCTVRGSILSAPDRAADFPQCLDCKFYTPNAAENPAAKKERNEK